MFWHRSGKRTSDHQEEKPLIEQAARDDLKTRLRKIFQASPTAEFTIRHLERRLKPVSLPSLAIVLAELQTEGLIDRISRVESPESHGGIEDFPWPRPVPDKIYDWRTGKEIEVTPENVALIFQAHAERLENAR